jgi:hypothetical protein
MKTIYKKLLFLFLTLPFSVFAQNTLSGVVLDAKSNLPLPGVNVVVQGANSSTSTDLDGKFKLGGLKSGDKIVFSYIGYNDVTLNYSGQKEVSISLEESSNQLQEVVVQVGYGTAKKKDATGSVAVISSKDFNRGAVLSADQLLVGKAAGVRITNNGGEPDTAPNIRIRGLSSLKAEVTSLSLAIKKDLETQFESQMAVYPFVFKSDMNEIYQTIHDLKNKVKSLEAQLAVVKASTVELDEEEVTKKTTSRKK